MNNIKAEKLPARILVVDDNRLNRFKLVRVLHELGHDAAEAENGREALAILQQETFNLMLLDIIMPEMDGFQVLEQMKNENTMLDLPVIVISAQGELDYAVRCIEMGAEDYLTKPFNTVLLTARINAALEKKRLRDQEQAYLRQLQIERQRLQQYTQELQARNEDLDAFAHTVAHDLKNPLGMIVGYAGLLEFRYGGKMDPSSQEQLQHIQKAGMKMASIIEALLLLAGIRNQSVELVPLDMAELLHEVKHRLSLLIEESGAEIRLPENWPTAVGYPHWVEEIWANYLSNAIKYGGRPPQIEIGATPLPDNTIRFWIRDNGQGIADIDIDRIFSPFIRLNQANVEGHGLGLSIVRRIIEKLGGSVGVESAVGAGSTFSFTLPGAQ
jgi:two-component system, sensor histidine kinase and response regulator